MTPTTPPQRILLISSEVESLARTGGLGDVVEALSIALARLGAHTLVVTPLYGVTKVPRTTQRWPGTVPIRFGWGPDDVRHAGVVELDTMRFPSGGSRRVCLLDDPGLFARGGIYGDAWGAFGDNELRFAVMSRGALEIAARAWSGGPDVIHAHDWHASFAILYAKLVMGDAWARTPSIFTVHNLAFQGVLDDGALDRLHLPRAAYVPEILWHEGNVNMMKGATALASRITTVSPTYAREILTPEGGFGLDLHFLAHQHKLVGILNGIEDRFDPRTDSALACRYDLDTASSGRAECKAKLAQEVGLEPGDGPLFAAVTRLTWQKGIDVLAPLLGEIVDAGGRVLVVGQGDADLEWQLRAAADRYRGRVAVRIAFDPPLSRRVYAGADFFFVPSRFEPCGLTQMYAMRYGAIPIVTDVGGLHDTVTPIDVARDVGTGLVARFADVGMLRTAVRQAFSLWEDSGARIRARARGMATDFSWDGPAARYAELYASLLRE
ncbi:MAG: glycogen synthase [Deltaproteobacteria bacterium]|nr:glycogen synthase [Deltaproteobacteria bacterium]